MLDSDTFPIKSLRGFFFLGSGSFVRESQLIIDIPPLTCPPVPLVGVDVVIDPELLPGDNLSVKPVNDVGLVGLVTDVKLGLVGLAGLVALVREVFDVNEVLDLAERLPILLVAERVALDIVADITAGDLMTLFDMALVILGLFEITLGLFTLLVVLDDSI